MIQQYNIFFYGNWYILQSAYFSKNYLTIHIWYTIQYVVQQYINFQLFFIIIIIIFFNFGGERKMRIMKSLCVCARAHVHFTYV